MPFTGENFAQYTPSIADSAYQFDYVRRVTIPAAGTVAVTFPASAYILKIRNSIISDMTTATGGTAPSTGVACYVRIDGTPAGAGAAPDGSNSRICKPGSSITIARVCAAESGVTLQNPNAAAVVIQVELGA